MCRPDLKKAFFGANFYKKINLPGSPLKTPQNSSRWTLGQLCPALSRDSSNSQELNDFPRNPRYKSQKLRWTMRKSRRFHGLVACWLAEVAVTCAGSHGSPFVPGTAKEKLPLDWNPGSQKYSEGDRQCFKQSWHIQPKASFSLTCTTVHRSPDAAIESNGVAKSCRCYATHGTKGYGWPLGFSNCWCCGCALPSTPSARMATSVIYIPTVSYMFIYFQICWTLSFSEQTGIHASLWFSETLVNHYLYDLMGVIVKRRTWPFVASIKRPCEDSLHRSRTVGWMHESSRGSTTFEFKRSQVKWQLPRYCHDCYASAYRPSSHTVFWGEVNHLQPGPVARYQPLREVSRLGHLMNSKYHDSMIDWIFEASKIKLQIRVSLKKKHPQLSNAHLTVSRLPNFNWSRLGNSGNDSVPQSQSSASQLLQPLCFGALHVDLSSMNNEQIRYVRFGTETVFLCFIVGGCQKYPK